MPSLKKSILLTIMALTLLSGCTQIVTAPIKVAGAAVGATIDVAGSAVGAVTGGSDDE